MKKVLFVATVVKIHIEVFHVPFLKWFKENGYEVHVCAHNDYENKEECIIPYCDKFFDIPFERSPFKQNNLKAQKELKSIINANDYDIIHCHTPVGGALGRLTAREARKKGTRVMYTAHGFHFYKGAPILNWLVYYPVERWLSRYTDTLITINKEDFNRASKFKAERIEFVPGVGLDIESILKKEIDREQKKKELEIPEGAFTLLSIGELNKNKNHEVVLKALAALGNKKIHYIVCGEGRLKEYLKNLSKELGIEKQVHMMGYRKDVNDICKTADLFIFPSYREGLSVALMESMANALPIVCSNIRGNADLVDENKGGYLVSPEKADEFATAINKMVSDSELRNRFGSHNRQKIENYSLEKVVARMEEIYTTPSISEKTYSTPIFTKTKS